MLGRVGFDSSARLFVDGNWFCGQVDKVVRQTS